MTTITESDLQQQLSKLGELRAAIGQAIVGQQDVVEQLLDHFLLVDDGGADGIAQGLQLVELGLQGLFAQGRGHCVIRTK